MFPSCWSLPRCCLLPHCQSDGDRSGHNIGRFPADQHSALRLTRATVLMKRAKSLMGFHAAMPIACLAVLLSCSGEPTTPPVSPPPPAQQEMPISGAGVPGLGPFDQSVRDLMRKYAIPGGAVALVRDGKLIYARGFGYADVENKTPVQPDALFRIASMSKPITSAAIMKLVEEGKLNLDDRVAPFIAYLTPAPGATMDPRWEQITVRHLLDHTGG